MLKMRFIGLTIFFFAVCALRSFAQLDIPYTSEITVDGRKTEWDSDHEVCRFVQRTGDKKTANPITIYAAWNEESLFLCYDVTDQQLVSLKKQDQSALYLNDAVEIYIDPLNDSKQRMDVNDYQFIVSIDGKSITLKGDKHLILDSSYSAPKEKGTSTLFFQYKLRMKGTLNDSQSDQGYIVECSIPFAGIGISPKENVRFKLDFCVDDADQYMDISSLAEGDTIPQFYYSSWKGSRNFSFPDQWGTFKLVGKPSVLKSFFKRYYTEITLFSIVIFGLLFFVVFRLVLRNRKLRKIPTQSDLLITRVHEDTSTETESTVFVHPLNELAEKHPLFEKCKDYVLQHIDRDISIEELASHVAVSARTLQRLSKEELNLSPIHFITVLKMEEAKKILLSGNNPVNEVAYRLGYSDVSYFGKIFKRYFGLTPKAFVNQHQAN